MTKRRLVIGIVLAMALFSLVAFRSPIEIFLQQKFSAETRKIPIRGIFVNSAQRLDDEEYVKSIKDIGANWVEIVLWVLVTEDGELIPYDESIYGPPHPFSMEEIKNRAPMIEELTAQRIKQAHDLGFKVFLCTYHERLGAHHEYGQGMKINIDNFLEEAGEIAVRWAEIAEDNKVEMYAPRKELQKFVGQKKALEWDDRILPALRSAYQGDLVRGALVDFAKWDPLAKQVWEGEELPASFAGWDYLGVDFYGSDTDTFEDLAAMYAWFAGKVAELKIKNNLKGVVFEELAEPHRGTESYWNDESLSGDEILNRLYQIYFEAGADSIEGFFPWIWEEEERDLPAGRREHVAPNKIIKQYYTASTIPSYDGPVAGVYPSLDVAYRVVRTLLRDDFDDGSNWELHGKDVSVKNGILEWTGHERATLKSALSKGWQNYVVSGEFMITDGEGFDFHVRYSDAGSYLFIVRPIALVQLVEPDGRGGGIALREIHYLVDYGKWYNFTIVAKDDIVQFFINDDKVLEYQDPTPLLTGGADFDVQGKGFVDNVVIREIE